MDVRPEIRFNRRHLTKLATGLALTAGLGLASQLPQHERRSESQHTELVSLKNVQTVEPRIVVLVRPKPVVPNAFSTQPQLKHALTPPAAHVPHGRDQRFVARYSGLATEVFKTYHIPIDLTLAQASHESDYNASALSQNGHNFFGIKASQLGCAAWHGAIYDGAKTHEIVNEADLPKYHPVTTVKRPDGKYDITILAGFRRYKTDREGFMDYGHLLVNRGFKQCGEFYADAQGDTDATQYLRDITDDDDGPAGPQKQYATDPNYFTAVSARIQAIHDARVALGLVSG